MVPLWLSLGPQEGQGRSPPLTEIWAAPSIASPQIPGRYPVRQQQHARAQLSVDENKQELPNQAVTHGRGTGRAAVTSLWHTGNRHRHPLLLIGDGEAAGDEGQEHFSRL